MIKKINVLFFILVSFNFFAYCKDYSTPKKLSEKKMSEIESFLLEAKQNKIDSEKVESYAKKISTFGYDLIPLLKQFIVKQNNEDLIYRIFTIDVMKNMDINESPREKKELMEQIVKTDKIAYIRSLALGILVEKFLVGKKEMILFLVGLLNDNEKAVRLGSVSETACLFLETYTQNSYGYIDENTSDEEKKKIISQWQSWWDENKDYLYWSPEELKFKTRRDRNERSNYKK